MRSGPIYERAPAVLSRSATDHVLVCRVGTGRVDELHGASAVVWLALDEPARVSEMIERIRDAGVEPGDPAGALDELMDAGYVVERDG